MFKDPSPNAPRKYYRLTQVWRSRLKFSKFSEMVNVEKLGMDPLTINPKIRTMKAFLEAQHSLHPF